MSNLASDYSTVKQSTLADLAGRVLRACGTTPNGGSGPPASRRREAPRMRWFRGGRAAAPRGVHPNPAGARAYTSPPAGPTCLRPAGDPDLALRPLPPTHPAGEAPRVRRPPALYGLDHGALVLLEVALQQGLRVPPPPQGRQVFERHVPEVVGELPPEGVPAEAGHSAEPRHLLRGVPSVTHDVPRAGAAGVLRGRENPVAGGAAVTPREGLKQRERLR